MNRNQASYLLGRVCNEYTPLVYAGVGTFAAIQAYHKLSTTSEHPQDPFFGCAYVAIGLVATKEVLIRGLTKLLAHHQEKTETRNVTERIEIADEAGLENVLQRTALDEELEFGTLLRTTRENQNVTITSILDPQAAEKQGLIAARGKSFVRLNGKVLEKESGYSGVHHYHPTIPFLNHSVNYAINDTDRFKPLRWTNLLTFNTPTGPELIGFDTKDTYLPTDATKRTLVRATPRDLWTYLADKPAV